MVTIVIPDPAVPEVPHKPLERNVPREVRIGFSSEWCHAYFELSGDRNETLHGKDGKRIVQGIAIMTKVGAVISQHMPDYMVAKINEIRLKNPVMIGNSILMRMCRIDGKERATQVRVELEHVNGSPITEMVLLLVR